MSWDEFRAFINWLPPSGDSALWRARKPRSWWVTPEYVALTELTYVGQVANWQRAGGKKAAPKPPKLPDDKEMTVKSEDDLADKRKAQAAQLKRRRAQQEKERR